MDEKRLSPDSVDGPMLCSQKKDKICLVCGDKALGYNFNAVSCESCKAFFRRNAHKTIRGRCEGKCDINVESRSFCKRCRLAKCFTVGMRKDMILDDHQKKLRKQKILINKLRRHGTLPPEDTYAVSESDLKQTCSGLTSPQDVQSLRKQFPNLPESDIQTLYSAGQPEPDSKKNVACELQSKLCKYQPWQDLEDIDDVINGMEEEERAVLLEMNKAHESSAFLSNTQTRLKSLPKNPTEFFNIADGFVRRIIKVAKQLKFFHQIDKDDQIALLKGSVVEIMMLRSAVNFDVRTETWSLSTSIKIGGSDTASNMSSPGSAGSGSEQFDFSNAPMSLDINKLREAAMNGADLNTLRNMAHGNMPPTGDVNKLKESAMKGADVSSTRTMTPPDIHKLREAALNGADLNSLKNMARGNMPIPGDIDKLRAAAMNGADLSSLRNMARGNMPPPSDQSTREEAGKFTMNVENMKQKYGLSIEQMKQRFGPNAESSSTGNAGDDLSGLRNAAAAAGFDVNALRQAAMSGASFEQLSQMAHAGKTGQVPPVVIKQEAGEGTSAESPSISSEILKEGNSETKTMFLTYSKFIRSLMSTIFGDLMILKFLIMLSLFSPDRHGLENKSLIEGFQEKYAHALKRYIDLRYSEEKNMFARCIMKLTDLRNVNEVHTKMLLKMQVADIEPLLVEIFDLPV